MVSGFFVLVHCRRDVQVCRLKKLVQYGFLIPTMLEAFRYIYQLRRNSCTDISLKSASKT